MTESEFLASEDPHAMLGFLLHYGGHIWSGPRFDRPSDRKLRLFACAVWRLGLFRAGEPKEADIQDARERMHGGIALAEEWADGGEEMPDDRHAVLLPFASEAARRTIVAPALRFLVPDAVKADIFRSVVGNPFRPTAPLWRLNPEWDRWQQGGGSGRVDMAEPRRMLPASPWLTPTVLSLTQAAYDERKRPCGACNGVGSFAADDYAPASDCNRCHGTGRVEDGTLDPARLAVLSDALEEAGCDCEPLLMHLRGWVRCVCVPHPISLQRALPVLVGPKKTPMLATVCPKCPATPGWVRSSGPHYRGMWSLDLILGKE